jgi:hypothetical protein
LPLELYEFSLWQLPFGWILQVPFFLLKEILLSCEVCFDFVLVPASELAELVPLFDNWLGEVVGEIGNGSYMRLEGG